MLPVALSSHAPTRALIAWPQRSARPRACRTSVELGANSAAALCNRAAPHLQRCATGSSEPNRHARESAGSRRPPQQQSTLCTSVAQVKVVMPNERASSNILPTASVRFGGLVRHRAPGPQITAKARQRLALGSPQRSVPLRAPARRCRAKRVCVLRPTSIVLASAAACALFIISVCVCVCVHIACRPRAVARRSLAGRLQ